MEVIILIIICLIGFSVITGIKTFFDNENSEVLSEEAYVKRKIDDTHVDANGVMNTTLTIVFTVKDKDIRCVMRHRAYRKIPKNSKGILTHKGTRFISFEFDGVLVEK